MKPFTTIVIEDEHDVRLTLCECLGESPYFDVVADTGSLSEAVDLITTHRPLCLFLDIKIKGGDAFQLIDTLIDTGIDVPGIILNTGFSQWEFAMRTLNEYSDHVIALLEKPFWDEWGSKETAIINKLQLHTRLLHMNDSHLKLKVGKSHFIIPLDEMIYIESDSAQKGRGVMLIHTLDEDYYVAVPLKELLQLLPPFFLQINRHTIINTSFIRKYTRGENKLILKACDKSFFITEAYKEAFLRFLLG